MDRELDYLLNQIDHKQLVVPVFQREYIWDLDHAKQLITSLFLRFPTGSLLFWETANPPQLKNLAAHPQPGSLINVILDGQQRLTTLYLLIRGEVPYYYNADEIEGHDPRDLFFNMELGEFKFTSKPELTANPLWIRVSDLFRETPNLMKIALNRVGSDNLDKAVELQEKLNASVNQLKGILKVVYPVQVVPHTADIDDAIRVFDLVNRQGTKLTEAELALAHMAGRWPEVRKVLLDKMKHLRNKGFDFDLTFMVRCMTAVVTHRAEYTQIHNRTREELLAGWHTLDQVLDYLTNLLSSHAYIHSTDDLTTPNVLVPLVAYLGHHTGTFSTAQERDRFFRWMYAALLFGRYSGQTDQHLDKDISIVLRSGTPTADLEKEIVQQRGRLEVRAGDMEGRDIRNPIYRMAFIVAKSRKAVDWFTGAGLSTVGQQTHGVNGYVFPWERLHEVFESGNHLHRQQINEIANRMILTKWPQVESRAENPLVYLEEVEARYPGSLAAYFIPEDRTLWHLERYEDFLKARRHLMAAGINQFMESLVAGIEPERQDLRAIIAGGETDQVEFKETLRLNLHTGMVEDKLKDKLVLEVSAFMNAEGGLLIVGVADDGTPAGIARDLASFVKDHTEDKYQLWLHQAIKERLGQEYLALVDIRFETIDDKRLVVLDVDPAGAPVYCQTSGQRDLHVRQGTAAQKLDGRAVVAYVQEHWG